VTVLYTVDFLYIAVYRLAVCSITFHHGTIDFILHIVFYDMHFWATVYKTVRLCYIGPLSVLSVCNVRALWPNCWTDQDETWHAGMASALATLC